MIIAAAGIVGWRLFFTAGLGVPPRLPSPVGRNVAVAALALFFGLLAVLPLAASLIEAQALSLFDSFYRAGSLVFGGGHVVLPLLEREVVGPGWVTEDDFLAGYGAAQAVPGPLFTFSAYLGTVMGPEPSGVLGATIALVAVFVPSFLLVMGGLAVWSVLRGQPSFQAALRGVNAAVVGLLIAALYNPVWTSAVLTESDFVIALATFGMLAFWKLPPWLMVVFAASAAEVAARL